MREVDVVVNWASTASASCPPPCSTYRCSSTSTGGGAQEVRQPAHVAQRSEVVGEGTLPHGTSPSQPQQFGCSFRKRQHYQTRRGSLPLLLTAPKSSARL